MESDVEAIDPTYVEKARAPNDYNAVNSLGSFNRNECRPITGIHVKFSQEKQSERPSKLSDLLAAKTSESLIEEEEKVSLAESEEAFYDRLQEANVSDGLVKQYLNYDLYSRGISFLTENKTPSLSTNGEKDNLINMLRIKSKGSKKSLLSDYLRRTSFKSGSSLILKDKKSFDSSPGLKRKPLSNIDNRVGSKTIKTKTNESASKEKSSDLPKTKLSVTIQETPEKKSEDKKGKKEHKPPAIHNMEASSQFPKSRKKSEDLLKRASKASVTNTQTKKGSDGGDGEVSHPLDERRSTISHSSSKARALELEREISREKINSIRKKMAILEQRNFFPTHYEDPLAFERARYVIQKLLEIETVEDDVKDPLLGQDSCSSLISHVSVYKMPVHEVNFLHFYLISKGIKNVDEYLTYRRNSDSDKHESTRR